MGKIKEVAYAVTDENGEPAPNQVLVERVGSGAKLPVANDLAQDRGIAGRQAFIESEWLGAIARDTAEPRERLALRAFPEYPHQHAARIADSYAGGPVTYWTAATYKNSRDDIYHGTVRKGFMTTETHVRGPRLLHPLLRRIGRLVTVNITELVVHPDEQLKGVATALADAALRDVPRGARVRFSVPEESVVNEWARDHELHSYMDTLVPREESPIGERVWMARYDLPVERVQKGLRAHNPWLAAGQVVKD
jgi:GNAT superfamily N-acetyltransferase